MIKYVDKLSKPLSASSCHYFYAIIIAVSYTSHFDDGSCLNSWIMSSPIRTLNRIAMEFWTTAAQIDLHWFDVHSIYCLFVSSENNWRQSNFRADRKSTFFVRMNLVKFHTYIINILGVSLNDCADVVTLHFDLILKTWFIDSEKKRNWVVRLHYVFFGR